ncbi:MAG: hypothetical protein APF81_27730 [Desulfosporosinus sp. BRH_c37]|nr:MAG: hypothetical protein APF81_27730 [Desulfosporosinus sp. BRH_c37]
MTKILYIVPDDSMVTYTRKILKEKFSDIIVEKGIWDEGANITKKMFAKGIEVVIARGGITVQSIRQVDNITVVETPITGFDIIRSVQEAKKFGNKLALIAFSSSMLEGVDYLAHILGVEIKQYFTEHPTKVEAAVLKAFAEGAEVVMGGITTTYVAKKHNLPYAFIDSSKESILQAAREAKYVEHALQIEKAKKGMFSTVLDYSYEGIITIDQDCIITGFNPAAQQLTKIESVGAIGQKIKKVLPTLNLDQVVETGLSDLHYLVQIKGMSIMCNKVPIIVNEKPVGAVATMQDVTNIQQMEARIRRDIHDRGHRANFTFDDILGDSPQICQAIEISKEFAKTHSNVLILGETGTGKEVFAQSIHNYSKRANGPFVAINCAALPSQILESELFGYTSGAFTGANKEGRLGLFEAAHGGTVFLDEVAEMDFTTQGKLLRVLQEKVVVRLGSDRVIPVDVRIIAATNKKLKSLVLENAFRDDLYYRLNVLRLTLPPLRERRLDVGIYAQSFLSKYASTLGRKIALSKSAIKWLEGYPWPGNIRELQNAMERTAAICKTDIVDVTVLSQICEDEYKLPTMISDSLSIDAQNILNAMSEAKGKYTAAAKILGISRSTLWRKIRRYGLNI